ncbi:MAG: hypothetical protein HWE34_14640 [Methylocystaceae bacterium]|nr:hypothetical protein [Methylocystaceae bacterium]
MENIREHKLPVLAMVNGVYAILMRNPMILLRAGLFPFLLLVVIGFWTTPPSWGAVGFQAMRSVEWILVLGLWTFYAGQLQRFVLKGPMNGAVTFLPQLNMREARYALASIFALAPLSVFAFWYDQPLFFNQPDLVIMGAMTALEGKGELLYAGLFLGWITQLFAFVLPAVAEDDERKIGQLLAASFEALRQDFSRLFAASLLVVLPVWLLFAMIRLVLHMPIFTQMAMADDASALAWNLIFFTLETLKVFLCGGLMAMVWALAYGRMRGKIHDLG